jgi:L-fucose mutarotase
VRAVHREDFTAMLKHTLLHPQINQVLGRAGHSSQVLIADGNYPAFHTLGPHAELVSLNLSPGIVSCCDVLRALVTAIPIEAAHTMGIPEDDPLSKSGDPPIYSRSGAVCESAADDRRAEVRIQDSGFRIQGRTSHGT